MQLIKLPSGAEVHDIDIAVIMTSVKSVWSKGLAGMNAVSDLYELAKRTAEGRPFRMPPESAELLRKAALLDSDGIRHDSIRDIILCAYNPDTFGLRDPRLADPSKVVRPTPAKAPEDDSKRDESYKVVLRDGVTKVNVATASFGMLYLVEAWRTGGPRKQAAVTRLYNAALQGTALSPKLLDAVYPELKALNSDDLRLVILHAHNPAAHTLQNPLSVEGNRTEYRARQVREINAMLERLQGSVTSEARTDWRSALPNFVSRVSNMRPGKVVAGVVNRIRARYG